MWFKRDSKWLTRLGMLRVKDIQKLNDELMEAVGMGNLATVKARLKEGANVNFEDESKHTPLERAVRNCRITIAEVLLDNGAAVDAVDRYKQTPLVHAITISKDPEMVRLLIDRHADVNLKDKYGWTPMRWANLYYNAEISEMLRQRGARL